MSLKDDRRQKVQFELDFSSAPTGEARQAGREETESFSTAHELESPARTDRLMEEACERENLKEALRRVKANKGSPGIDGMSVGALADYLQQHWPAIREQLLQGTYEPQPVKRVEIPKPAGGGAKAWHPYGAGSIHPAGGDAGPAEAVGPDVFRTQLRVPAGTVGPSSGSTGAAVHGRRLQLGGGS